jgi:opacity protein-like surface antigen
MRIGIVVYSLAIVCGIPALAAAQDQRRAGVTMGYPASIGVLWNVAERVAVRPEVSFTRTSNDFTFGTGTATGTSSSVFNVGASALFYLARIEKIRTYVSPRFSYGRSTASNEGSELISGTSNSYSAIGSFGAQYALSDRFTVFGEVGIGYTDQRASSGTGDFRSTNKTSTWSSRTGIGLVLFF